MEKAGARGRPGDIEGSYARQIANRLLPELTYHCARFEPNALSMNEVEALFEQDQTNTEPLSAPDVLTLNLFEAIRYLLDNAGTLEFDVTGVCTLHYLLSDALVADHHAGKVRERGIINHYSTYLPIEDPKRLQRLLGNICAKAMHIENPYEQSLFILIHITYLQPFIAANRRTARLCANIPLVRHNLVPLTFADINVDDYTAAVVSILENKQPKPMAQLYFQSYLNACRHYDDSIKVADFDPVRVKYRQHRRALIKQVVAGKLTGDKILAEVVGYSKQHIDETEQFAFEKSVMTEFQQLSPQRIAGTGLSRKQLNDWLALES